MKRKHAPLSVIKTLIGLSLISVSLICGTSAAFSSGQPVNLQLRGERSLGQVTKRLYAVNPSALPGEDLSQYDKQPFLAGNYPFNSHLSSLRATANASGIISTDTTWTLAQSPIVVTDSVVVSANVTLTVEPGVTVRVQAGKGIIVDGTLIARGTDALPITFTSDAATPQPGDWGVLMFSDSSTDAAFDAAGNYAGGSVLEHVTIEYAGGGTSRGPAVQTRSAAPFVNHSTIRNNYEGGFSADAVGGSVSPPVRLTNNTVTNSGSFAGIGVHGLSAVVDRNNVSHSSTGVRVKPGPGQTAQVTNNLIKDNYAEDSGGAGLLVYGEGATLVSNNSILDNGPANYAGGGILILGGTVTVSDNIIRGNSSYGGYNEGGGIAVGSCCISAFGGFGVITVTRNVIADNATGGGGGGISVYSPATITGNTFVGNSADSGSAIVVHNDSTTITNNTFSRHAGVSTVAMRGTSPIRQNNFVNNTSTYDLHNRSAGVDATNNWWGTAVDAAVQDRIFDHTDDATVGIVNYQPLLDSPNLAAPVAPPTGLQVTAGAGTLTLGWTAGPETDVTGYKVYYDTDSGCPYSGVGAAEGASPIDVGNATSFMLTGLPTGVKYLTVTAYDLDRDGANDQTDGNESWFAAEMAVTVVDKATPSLSNLSSPVITYGTALTVLTGEIRAGSSVPQGNVSVTLNGITQTAPISGADGSFSATFTTGSLAASTTPYAIDYDYEGDANFFGTHGTGSMTINKATATVTLNNLSQTFDGSAKSAGATTDPAGLSVSLSYNQNGQPVSAPVNAGFYDVTAIVDDPNYNGSASGTLVINKAAATISLGGLSHTYDGSPRQAITTTSPAGLSGLSITYDGLTSPPANAGSYAVVASLVNQNYAAPDATGTLVIDKAATTASIDSSLNPSVGGQAVTFTVTVTGTGGPPPGGVEFFDGATSLGSAPLIGGAASLTTSAPQPGARSVTGVYTGGANFSGTTTPVLIQIVSAPTPAGKDVSATGSTETCTIQLTFSNVTAAGTTTITPIDPSSLTTLGDFAVDGSTLAFDISTTATFRGQITICFQVPSVTDQVTFNSLRILHYVSGKVVAEKITSRDWATKTICTAVNSLSPFVVIRTTDFTPPAIGPLRVDKPVLWPPNHKMVGVTVGYEVTDNYTPADELLITLSVTSNEPEDGTGDGDVAPDWEVVDGHRVRLRAERAGTDSGRVYTVIVTASDRVGNATSRAVTVSVPKSPK